MAAAVEPWGLTPLTTEGLAKLGHPLSVSDFNKDASGRYWRMIRGQKTYYPKEWFASTGLFTGPHTQAGDPAGQDKSFFKLGVHWNWEKGEWENPTNWANVIGTSAAGVVGGGILWPVIAGGAGGGAGAGGVGIGETGATTGVASGAGLPGAVAAPAVSDLAVGGSAIGTAGGVGIGETGATVGTDLGPAGLTSYPSIATGANAGPVAGSAGNGAAITNLLSGGASGGGGTGGVVSWLTGGKGALLGDLVNVFGGIYAANKQAGASEEALKQQQAQFDEALKDLREERTYNRNQYGDYLGRLSPYMASGNDANYRESQYMAQPSASGGFPRPSSVAPPTPMPGSGPAAAAAPAATPGGGMAPAAGGSTTRMRSPDGHEQDVPTAQVQHYLDMGATVIGNRYTTMGQ